MAESRRYSPVPFYVCETRGILVVVGRWAHQRGDSTILTLVNWGTGPQSRQSRKGARWE